MQINKQNLFNITKIELENLLDYIGINILRSNFITSSKKLNIHSKYYIGKKGNGKFWNGFRTTNIGMDKIKKAYLDEYNVENSEINIIEMLDECIKTRETINNIEELQDKISLIDDLTVIDVLCKIYQIKEPNEIEIISREKNKIENQYNEKIISIKEEEERREQQFEKAIKIIKKEYDSKLLKIDEKNKLLEKAQKKLFEEKSELTKEKNELVKEIKDLNKKITSLDFENIKMIQQIEKTKQIFENKYNEKINRIISYRISKENVEELTLIKNYKRNNLYELIETMLKNNISKYSNSENIKFDLVKEYVLVSMMEEEYGITRDKREV